MFAVLMKNKTARSRFGLWWTVCAILALTALSGCSTSFTNMTPTRALDPLEVEVGVRGQAQVYSNIVGTTIAGGRDVYDVVRDPESDEPITEEQFRQFIDAGLAFLLFRPGVDFELGARIGLWEVLEGMDLGLRYNFNVLKGDLKLQFWESEDGQGAISGIIGVGKQSIEVPSVAEWLALTKWSRTDFDFQLSAGWELPDIVKVYANPRLMLSRVSVEHKLPEFIVNRLPEEILAFDPNQLFRNELMVFWGATLGAMAGYKYVFLAFELNIFKMEFEPIVIGSERNFDSLVVAPSLGLVGTW